ncbi:3-carboxy-cis,cis-muconate cycloisomerase [Planosporangium mesophilum]|nr:3-carboxy-cis,cis-muconate cycloisomerase [Planosporangium mesophilum]
MFGDPGVDAATGDRAWLQALLDVEAGLARAEARAGLVPQAAAEAITAACVADRFDPADLARRAVGSATVVIPLVEDLRGLVGGEARNYVHAGATSQDIVDSAMSLVAKRASAVIESHLAACADRLAALADEHRHTVQIGRTLLQQALPTTFGVVCAGWLVALDEARTGLARVRAERLAVQLGGAVGTLASLGEHGPRVADLLADELGLATPTLPWHTARGRVAELAAALGVVAGALGTVALDVTLLSQTEVAEVAEGTGGGSSAMPHKRNPARSVLVNACAHRVPGLVATVFAALPQEAQRAAGRWQAEWETVTELLRLTGGAAGHTRALLADLRVDPVRMRANLDAGGGLTMAESAVGRLAGAMGRERARAAVTAASKLARESGGTLRDALLDDPEVRAAVGSDELDAALEPASYLGAAEVFVDRALRAHFSWKETS